jgi:hypothetical protein
MQTRASYNVSSKIVTAHDWFDRFVYLPQADQYLHSSNRLLQHIRHVGRCEEFAWTTQIEAVLKKFVRDPTSISNAVHGCPLCGLNMYRIRDFSAVSAVLQKSLSVASLQGPDILQATAVRNGL